VPRPDGANAASYHTPRCVLAGAAENLATMKKAMAEQRLAGTGWLPEPLR
jgi:hypothetical protein